MVELLTCLYCNQFLNMTWQISGITNVMFSFCPVFVVLPLFVFFIFSWTCDIDSEFCEWRHFVMEISPNSFSHISLQAASKLLKMIHAQVNDYFRIIKILILFPQRTWRPLSFDIFFQKFIMSTFFNLLLLLLA